MRIAVVSPHLDDGVLSLGATINGLVRQGHEVDLITVFAGDLDSDGPPSYWDAKRGLSTKSEVVAVRRREDERAARRLGAHPVWLGFDDDAYLSTRDPSTVWASLAPLLLVASAVLVPGFPLVHSDHRFTTLLVVDRLRTGVPIYFYAELPYASRALQTARSLFRGRGSPAVEHALGQPIAWDRARVDDVDRAAKRQAMEAYAGELSVLGLTGLRSLSREIVVRDERIAGSRSGPSFARLVGPAGS